jgi:hypothetical protein
LTQGHTSAGVDPGLLTFANHGCDGSTNFGRITDIEESVYSHEKLLSDLEGLNPFDLYEQRNFPSWDCDLSIALRDIQPNEEMFDNYMSYGGVEYWKENLEDIVNMCSGSLGLVSQVELAQNAKMTLSD